MQLIYKIEFNTTNLYFKHIIEDLIKEAKVNAVCKQYKGFILIILDEIAQNIESFFALLEKKLPVSIFIGNSYVIESYDESWQELEDFEIKQNLSLLTNEAIRNIIEDNNIDFLNDIVKITKGEISRFETHNGLKDIFLPNKLLREEFEKKEYEVKLLITDTSKLDELFDLNMKDFQLLCSIERPLVKLKFKVLKNVNKDFSSTNFIYAKIPDDKETVLFARALKEQGINYVLYVNDEVYQDGLKVTYTKEQNLIIHGDKGLFPKYDFVARKKFNSSKEYFDENGGVYKAILAQTAKRLVPTIGVYFSQNSLNSSISINIPTKGVKKIITIPNIPPIVVPNVPKNKPSHVVFKISFIFKTPFYFFILVYFCLFILLLYFWQKKRCVLYTSYSSSPFNLSALSAAIKLSIISSISPFKKFSI